MSEHHYNQSVYPTVRHNEQMRSWIYALAALLCMMWGMNVYLETRPFFAILGIYFAIRSMRAGHMTMRFNAKYVSAVILAGCILEIIAGFHF